MHNWFLSVLLLRFLFLYRSFFVLVLFRISSSIWFHQIIIRKPLNDQQGVCPVRITVQLQKPPEYHDYGINYPYCNVLYEKTGNDFLKWSWLEKLHVCLISPPGYPSKTTLGLIINTDSVLSSITSFSLVSSSNHLQKPYDLSRHWMKVSSWTGKLCTGQYSSL